MSGVLEVQASLATLLAADLAMLPHDAVERAVGGLAPSELEALWYEWGFWARPEQLAPPGDWQTWLLLAGRGFGKTRSGAEYIRGEVEQGRAGRVALVAATAADARDIIVEGESGILATAPPWFRPDYEPSKRRITWPNGAIATCFSAEEPDRLRGPQHDLAWGDELAAWAALEETWNMMLMGLRLGPRPRIIVTTTPRPLALLRELVADEATAVTRGATSRNRLNLAASYIRRLRRFEGTQLGRQELEGEILDDRTGAMFSGTWFRRLNIEPGDLLRVVVAIDPAVSTSRTADETGIVVAGADASRRGFVLEDLSGKLSPQQWARRAIKAFDDHAADAIVVETNRGGEMVAATIRAELAAQGRPEREIKIVEVHASRGKATRAEPVAALYEQGRVFHVGAAEKFARLERQLVEWDPTMTVSPDRVDALVWAMTALALGPAPEMSVESLPSVSSRLDVMGDEPRHVAATLERGPEAGWVGGSVGGRFL